MGLALGEEGTEQFTVTTRVNDKLIKTQPVHDPFIHSTVTLKGWGHAWRALIQGIKVQIAVDGSHGVMRAIMTLDPEKLAEDSKVFLEQMAQRRAANDAAQQLGATPDRLTKEV